jgi:hypothetical protein
LTPPTPPRVVVSTCPPLLQFVTNRLINSDVDLQAAQLGSVLSKRAGVVGGRESRHRNSLFRQHSEFDIVQNELNGCLVLQIASCHADYQVNALYAP